MATIATQLLVNLFLVLTCHSQRADRGYNNDDNGEELHCSDVEECLAVLQIRSGIYTDNNLSLKGRLNRFDYQESHELNLNLVMDLEHLVIWNFPKTSKRTLSSLTSKLKLLLLSMPMASRSMDL